MASTGAGDIFTEGQTTGDGVITLAFSFAPNGSTNPVSTTIKGKGVATITYVTGSMWELTLNSKYNALLGWSCGIMNAAGATAQGYKIEVDGTTTDVTTGIVRLRSINTGSTAADIAAVAGTRVSVLLVLSISSSNA